MIPHQRALVERLRNQPFTLLGVNTDTDKDAYRSAAREHGVSWRSAWDGSTTGPWCKAWGVTSFPSTYVLDAQGTIRFIGLRGDELDRAVLGLLDELARAHHATGDGAQVPGPKPRDER